MISVDRDFFNVNGYWVCPEMLFSPVFVSVIRYRFDEVLAGKYATGIEPRGVAHYKDGMAKAAYVWKSDSVLREVIADSRIAEMAARLLGVDEVYLWADSLYFKAPGAEEAIVGWHQDAQYWGHSSTTEMITACIPLYDANENTGGLRFARGSHRWGLVGGTEALAGDRRARPPVPAGEQWDEVCPELLPGQATFHHALTFHGSGPNRSSQPRRSITVHMVPGHARLVSDSVDPYFDVGKGKPFRGPNFPRLWP